MKIVILQPLKTDISSYLSKLKDYDVTYFDEKTSDKNEIISRISDADILISDNTLLNEEILSKDQNLKALFIAFSGLDHIDLTYCEKHNIKVINAKTYSKESVAELSLMFLLMALRKFNLLKPYHNEIEGKELTNLNVGLVGLGNIAISFINLLKSFENLTLCYTSKSRHLDLEEKYNIKYLSKEELLSKSDVISLHLPLTNSSLNYLNKDEFKLMKDNAILINTSRAKLVNKESLIDFMKNHKDFIYCSDLLYDESNFDNNLDLVSLPNLIYTPHIGFFTKEAMENRAKIIFDYLFDYLDIDK